MYRFLARPKWIGFTLMVVGGAVLMVSLGFWQLRRLDERQSFNDLVRSRTAAPIAAFAALDEQPVDEREWRAVAVTGRYEGDTDQVPTAGGYLLVSPFATTDGPTVYVNRGTVGSADAVPPPPAGTVELVARFRTAPSAATAVPADALFVERVESVPDEPAVDAPVLPRLDDGPHLGYAVQWFIFSGCVLIGWVLAVRRSARTAAAATGSARGPGSPATPQRRNEHRAVPWQDEPGVASTPANER